MKTPTLFDLAVKRRNFAQMQSVFYDLYLSGRLFGHNMATYGIVDFEMSDYCYFLDNVKSLDDLIVGLVELSPFANDALNIAQKMSPIDFSVFKLALPRERMAVDGAPRCMPEKFVALLLPSLFLEALFISSKARVSLGITLLRLWENKTF